MPKGMRSKNKMKELKKESFLSQASVTLFSHFEGPDSRSHYVTIYYDIDPTTGELTKTYINDSDMFLRPGSRSVEKTTISYESFYRAVSFYDAEHQTLLRQITPENFREWLDEHWEILL